MAVFPSLTLTAWTSSAWSSPSLSLPGCGHPSAQDWNFRCRTARRTPPAGVESPKRPGVGKGLLTDPVKSALWVSDLPAKASF